MPTEEKQAIVARLNEAVSSSISIYVAEFSQLSANDMNELRGHIGEADAELVVVKNRLFRLALAGTEAEGLAELITGPRAVIFCYSDAIAPAGALFRFGAAHSDVITLKGGFAEGEVLTEEQANFMATLPSRDELIANVVGGIASPITGLVFTLSGLVSDLVFTLQAVADQKNESAA